MHNAERNIEILDDGTLDTVVRLNGEIIRFDSEYRFSFASDDDFLNAVWDETDETVDYEEWENYLEGDVE